MAVPCTLITRNKTDFYDLFLLIKGKGLAQLASRWVAIWKAIFSSLLIRLKRSGRERIGARNTLSFILKIWPERSQFFSVPRIRKKKLLSGTKDDLGTLFWSRIYLYNRDVLGIRFDHRRSNSLSKNTISKIGYIGSQKKRKMTFYQYSSFVQSQTYLAKNWNQLEFQILTGILSIGDITNIQRNNINLNGCL